jgi:hypothetical protein
MHQCSVRDYRNSTCYNAHTFQSYVFWIQRIQFSDNYYIVTPDNLVPQLDRQKLDHVVYYQKRLNLTPNSKAQSLYELLTVIKYCGTQTNNGEYSIIVNNYINLINGI